MNNRPKKELIKENEQLRKQLREASLTNNNGLDSHLKTEDKFQELFEKSSDALLIIENNIFTDCNIATSKMLGYSSKNEFLNVHPSKLSPEVQPDGKNSFEKAEEMMRLAFKKSSHRFEWIHTKKNGENFPVEVLLTTITNKPNNKVIYCVWRDITERKKGELKLKESEEKFSKLYNNSPDMFISVSAKDASILQCNDTLIKKTGYSRKEIIGAPIFNMYHDDCIDEVKKAFKQFITKGVIKNKELILKKKNGSKLYISLNVNAVKDKTGKIIHSISSWRDITESKKAEEDLIESYNIINSSPVVVFLWGNEEHWNVKFVSKNVTGLLGYSAKEFLQNKISYKNLIHPEDFNRVDKELFDYSNSKQRKKLIQEYRVLTKDGKVKWVRDFPKIQKDKNNAITHFHAVLQDITQQKEIEKTLNESEISLLKAQEVAHLGSWQLDLIENTIQWTNYTYKIFDIPQGTEVDYNKFLKMVHPDDRDYVDKKWDEALTGEPYNIEHRILVNNEVKWVREVSEFIFDNNGKPLYAIGVVQDITKNKLDEIALKKSEEKLKEALKITNLGTFAFNDSTDLFETSSICDEIIGIDKSYKRDIQGWINLVHPNDYEKAQQLLDNPNLKSITKEFRIIRPKDKKTIWILGHAKKEYDDKGVRTKITGTLQDISERIKAEKDLKESEEFLNLTGEIAKVGGWEFITNTLKFSWTDEVFVIHEIPLGQLPSLEEATNFYHPDDRPKMEAVVQKAIENGESWDDEFRLITAKGNLIWTHSICKPIIKNGKTIKLVGAIQDITEKKDAEISLQNAYTQVKHLKKKLEEENIFLKKEIALSFNYEDMVYSSHEISDVLTQVEQVSSTDATVLILGETGTGKELIAKAIHNTSDRKSKSLIRVNCAAIPFELIESELFGHIKGSFTGAINNRIGKFELANGGTLFLDEIGEMPLALQPKLLRAIQEGEIEPIGSSKVRKLDVRIVAATNKDLKKEVEEKRFREDLYFRLNVFPITIPPLRERIEDIPVLIDHFVNKYCKKHGKAIKYISDSTLQQMKSYTWPGNIRELENLIERAVIISNQELLIIKEFDNDNSQKKKTIIKHSSTALNEVQRNHIIKILNKTQWKIDGKQGAAVLLNIKPSTLRDRMKKFGIIRPKV